MIDVHGLRQHYGARPVLKNITLHVERGELVCLMGPNGMGKSTLMGAMAGVLTPQKGYVAIDGVKRKSSPENELAIRKKTYYMPAEPWLPLQRTLRELLVAVGGIYEIEDERLFDHIERLAEVFAMSERLDAEISSYSSGQLKKTALCAALVSEAPVMFLDEPFSGGLDPSGLLALRRILAELGRRDDVTVVMATPVPELVEGLADRIAVLRDGDLAAYGSTDELRELAKCDGTLGEVLEQLIEPHTLEHIERYFESRRS